jgi:hypothetical protein
MKSVELSYSALAEVAPRHESVPAAVPVFMHGLV